MGRLYYEQKAVLSNMPTPENALVNPPANNNFTDYLNKVSRLIPSEVIAGYLTMFGLVHAIKSSLLQSMFSWIVFVVGLVLTPLYLNSVSDENKPKRNHLILSTIAFVVWAYVTTGETLSETIATGIYDSAAASIILIIFSFISALVPLDK
ncbi:hypothetical protein GR160_16750 [Flavobacterium sp. Sd200]|uniref:hypothetical protein n=1 Tax=Flavobacterium sp. Sd200 TaxID=2692211 RepID=UPI00136B956F|nr:hypothetical protein [Flavobacterium sp. Sd200]MXN92878.1 hypothetical protein [Flavobacterium sp. Sd200]